MRRLASLRIAAGYSRQQLARHLNVFEDAVTDWERGMWYPPAYLLKDYAGALRISVELLRQLINEERLRAGSPQSCPMYITDFRNFGW